MSLSDVKGLAPTAEETRQAERALDERRSRLVRLRATWRHDWPVWLVAGLTLANGLMGIGSVLASRFVHQPRLFSLPLPFGLYHWSRSLTLAFGLALVYLSLHLFGRLKSAWGLALVGSLLAAAAHVGRGNLWYAAIAPAITALLLGLTRPHFTVRSEPRSIVRGLGFMALSLLVALAYGTLGFYLLDKRDFGIDFGLGDALLRTLREFAWLGNPDLVDRTRHALWFLDSLHVLGGVATAFALASLFQPVTFRLVALPQQREHMRHLLETYGGTADDYFKLMPDKSYFFSADGRSGLAYAARLGVAVALGDPIGPPEDIEALLTAFARMCANNGWLVAFYQVLPDLLPLYRQLGLAPFKLGEEAVVDLEHYVTETLRDKHPRHLRNKFAKEGYQVTRHAPPHAPELLEAVQRVSDAWLKLPGHVERRFSLWYFDRAYLNATPLWVLRDAQGVIWAFANETPSFKAGEATLDLMRHQPEGPPSAMEYILITMMIQLREQGYRTFNLGMAPYVGMGEGPEATGEERVAHQLAMRATRFFSAQGLRGYKEKFEPVWEPRYLLHQGGATGLIRTAAAILRLSEV